MAPSAAPEGENPYAPPGPPPTVFSGFTGLNTEAARPSIEDDQCSWMDGFMPVGRSTARTMWDVGPAIWSNATLNVWFDFANIGANPIMIVALQDGSLWQVNTNTSVTTEMAGPGTITAPNRTQVGISQWGAQFVIIVANQPNGYFLWDGTTFYAAGDSVPGFTTMPTGVSGTSVEIYQNRVWISNGATIIFSAPASLTDFATGDGGGAFTSVDSFLRTAFIQLRQSNGFLYMIADSSINYLSGVSTSGSPPTTTFSNQNADPEIGTPWAPTVDVISRNIVFANAFGAHISYGGSVTKVSDDLDGVYSTVPNFGGFVPSACKAIVFGKRVWMVLIPVIDVVTGQQANKLFCWDGKKKWWSTSQGVPLVYVQHQEINSVITAYGTDGFTIYPLFQKPSVNFTKRIQSKLFARPGGLRFQKSADRLWGIAQYYNLASPAITVTVDSENSSSIESVTFNPTGVPWINNAAAPVSWINNASAPVTWNGPGIGIVVFPPESVAQNGVTLGVTVSTNCADVALLAVEWSSQIVQYRG